jgi:hypothetical protein
MRPTSIICKQDVIQWAQGAVKPKGHMDQVLNLVQTMTSQKQAAWPLHETKMSTGPQRQHPHTCHPSNGTSSRYSAVN